MSVFFLRVFIHICKESKKLSAAELMRPNCGVREDSWESLGLWRPVHTKGNQSWIFIRSSNAEAETPVLWPSDAKYWLIGKDLDAGKDRRLEEKRMTETQMVGWHHRLDGHVFEQLQELVKDWETWCAIVHVDAKSQIQTTQKWLGGLPHCLLNTDIRTFIKTIYFVFFLEQAFIPLLRTDQKVKRFPNACLLFKKSYSIWSRILNNFCFLKLQCVCNTFSVSVLQINVPPRLLIAFPGF